MPTEQAELTTEQTELATDRTELIEKLNVLEFETSQLNRAFQLWRSYVEQGTALDWMVVAIRISYDALIRFCLETISALAPATSHTDGGTDPRVRFPALADPSLVLAPVTQENQMVGLLTTDPTELIEKLNVLEFEASQLNLAYQRWRSYLEQGRAPDWMAVAIRITYDALITFCLDTISALAPATSHVNEIECYEPSVETAPPLVRALLAKDSIAALYLRNGQRLQYDDAETDPLVRMPAPVDPSLVLTPVRQQNRIAGELTILADGPRALSARRLLVQLKAAAREISGMLGEESPTEESSPELLPMTEPDWSRPEMPVAIARRSTGDAISDQPAIQRSQEEQKEEAGIELAAIRIPATLANWLQGSSIARFFLAACVPTLIVVGGALGIYMASAQRTALKQPNLPVQNSTTQGGAGVIGIPTGEKAGFKFDPDPVVARQGRSFVLNAVLSRASDIASMAVQIDYDANLLQFKGVAQGGSLVKAGQQVVLVQRDDPSTGVLRISAEKSPGAPGISGDGPVFALSFQARKRGDATVSIVPGAHDSQGRRIEMAGSQVAVRVN